VAEQRYTAQQVVGALTRAKGIKAAAAKYLGCDRTTVEHYCKRYAACRDAVAQERASFIDLAEGKLYESVASGDLSAVKFVLTTIGKDRGYVETVRNEHTGADGGPLRVTFRVERRDEMDAPLTATPRALIAEAEAGDGE